MSLLVLDNYDSFTYNLVEMLRQLGVSPIEVHRNDKISLEDIERFNEIVLSPGPGIPSEAGIMPEVVRKYSPSKKILGVCLGHQCIGEVFGGSLENLSSVVHGKASQMKIIDRSETIFSGLPDQLNVGRYHSWVVKREGLPKELKITAESEDGYIMAISHVKFKLTGVQFHPESVLTEHGSAMLENWLRS